MTEVPYPQNPSNMPYIIQQKSDCCGCTACASICPRNAIRMVADDEGFLYPIVDEQKCISCDLCEKVCPEVNKPNIKTNLAGYIVRNKDKDVLFNSSSGGFYTALCEWIISHNGIVYGAAFDSAFNVRHISATTIEQCVAFRGSKYVQSNLTEIFPKVRQDLRKGLLVCFSGTPCQIAGLRNYLRKDFDNLILVDFVCHGVSSPMLWDEYKKVIESKYHSLIIKTNFRSKRYGYQSSSMQIVFENGRIYQGSPRVEYDVEVFLWRYF